MIGETLSASLSAFQQHWKSFAAIGGAVLAANILAFAIMMGGVFSAVAAAPVASDAAPALGLGYFVSVFVASIILTVSMLWGTAVMTNAAKLIFEGQPVTFSAARQGISWAPIIVAMLLAGVITVVTCGIGSIVMPFVTALLIPVVLHGDAPEGGFDALKRSFNCLKDNFVDVLLLVIAISVLGSIASFLILPIYFVALPIQALAAVYMYRKITGRPNAAH